MLCPLPVVHLPSLHRTENYRALSPLGFPGIRYPAVKTLLFLWGKRSKSGVQWQIEGLDLLNGKQQLCPWLETGGGGASSPVDVGSLVA